MNPFSVMAWVLALAGIIVWLFTAGAAGGQYGDAKIAVLTTSAVAQSIGLTALGAALILSGLRWLLSSWTTLTGSVARDVAARDERAGAEHGAAEG
ncbi:hypothetical protein JCM13591A_19830 [Microbacterium xylanilyticum]